MSADAVQPLRIAKTSPAKSHVSPSSRALAEISPMERRRNSPSWNQATKRMIVSREPSPYDSSVLSSPRQVWQSKLSSATLTENAYERPDSPSLVHRRKSIENLKMAGRVKNSSMFAREHASEYDPSSPVVIERPLAAGRPLNGQPQMNELPLESAEVAKPGVPARGHRRGESQSQIPKMPSYTSNSSYDSQTPRSPSPLSSRNQPSPTKSSLANKLNTFPRRFDPSTAELSDDDDGDEVLPSHPLRRQGKSVTFDVAPPQINEYEMVTPDPSSVASGSREGSYDMYDDEDEDLYDMDRAMGRGDEDSFDASLEDTDKTPVVLPEDWRGMTPDVTESELAANFEDPFTGDNDRATPTEEWNKHRAASVESDRPLPPVPPFMDNNSRRNSGNILDRVHNAHRSLPAPPAAASISKSDIRGMRDHAMSLEDRLKLMGLHDESAEKTSPDQAAREKARLQRHGLGIHVFEDEEKQQKTENLPDFSFPRISRESILRKVKSRNFDNEEEKREISPLREYDVDNLDPDVPIPSREVSSNFDEGPIKEEDNEDLVDLYSIPAMYAAGGSSEPEDNSREGSVIHHEQHDDADSVYSTHEGANDSNGSDQGPPTPRQGHMNMSTSHYGGKEVDVSLPEISALMEDSELHASLQSYLDSGDDDLHKRNLPSHDTHTGNLDGVRDYMARAMTPEQNDVDEADSQERGSLDSVVHHPVMSAAVSDEGRVSPVVPEPLATIKAPGGKLKTRPSLAPADIETMAATRRQVSGTHPPPVPDKSPKRFSFSLDDRSELSEKGTIERAVAEHKKRRESFKMRLDLGEDSMDLSLDMNKEFDRVIESSKKGYLMRQNTKVVVAKRTFSNEQTSLELDRPNSADEILIPSNGPGFRPSHERAKSWTTEPWNGKTRRKSLRSVDRSSASGPAPPLPGQESAVGALGTVLEDQIMQQDEIEEGVERGRLFVKVVGVKDLDLPIPQSERTWFQLTLDNGLHCVTTSRLELGRSAPIGQEFELVVLNDLEFQLTLQTHITPPAKPSAPEMAPAKAKASPKKSALSRFLASPKKRREQERQQQQQKEDEARQHREFRAAEASRRANTAPSAWDLLHDLVASDGSFGRAYVSLKTHESACFGRPITLDMPVFNEWAVENDASISSSVKSKRGAGVLRRPPYEVGKLTLQLLYVPRPKGLKEEDMPKSMNMCIREMATAERAGTSEWEGFLSQQGGDCPYWRRRFFRLSSGNLTAYHETTRQPRAKISLARATKLIDDKSSLLQHGSKANGKGRRKSAFADEDQAYMFVEEGFRIRFANGEAIDFYADSAADKTGWMQALAGVVGQDVAGANAKGWCSVVVQRERVLRERAELGSGSKTRPRSQGQAMLPPSAANMLNMKSQPSSPVKRDALGILSSSQEDVSQRPPPPRMQDLGPRAGRLGSRRKQIRSMIF